MTVGEWSERTWSVALFGHFNPWIATGAWMERFEIITPEERVRALENLDPSGAAIRLGSLSFEVSLERFLVQTNVEAERGRLPEVTAGVFGVLGHTPVESLAIGFDGEWSVPDAGAGPNPLSLLLRDPLPAAVAPVVARSVTLRLEGISGPGATTHLTVEDADEDLGGIYFSLVDEVLLEAEHDLKSADSAVGELQRRWSLFTTGCEHVVEELVQALG